MSPFYPGKENTPPPRGPAPHKEGTLPKESAAPKEGTLPKEGTPPKEDTSSKAAKKAAMDEFKEDYLIGAGKDEWTDLTLEQAANRVEAFRIYWKKK